MTDFKGRISQACIDWDAWLQSGDGVKTKTGSAAGEFLENRLWTAFMAGHRAGAGATIGFPIGEPVLEQAFMASFATACAQRMADELNKQLGTMIASLPREMADGIYSRMDDVEIRDALFLQVDAARNARKARGL